MKTIKNKKWNSLHLFLNREKKGITLIELLIGIIIAVIISLTVGVILLHTSSMFRETEKRLRIEKEASYTIMKMEKEMRVKKSEDIEIDEDGEKLILDKNNENSSYFQKIDNDIVYYDGNELKTLIRDKVEELNFTYYTDGDIVKNNLIKISLSLSDEKNEYRIKTYVKLRNE